MSNKRAFALGVLTVFGVNAIINLATEIVCCRVRKSSAITELYSV